MKDKFEFYQNYYFRELNRKNEINGSLSIPIGLITALVGALFYLSTTFDYHVKPWLTILFLIAACAGTCFLFFSIYNLIKAYTNFPKRYEYILIADVDAIEEYHKGLQEYYGSGSGSKNFADRDLEDYLIGEMVKNTGVNQRNNKRKTKFSYNCEKHLINTLILIIFSLIFYSVDYVLKPEKKPSFTAKIAPSGTLEIMQNSK